MHDLDLSHSTCLQQLYHLSIKRTFRSSDRTTTAGNLAVQPIVANPLLDEADDRLSSIYFLASLDKLKPTKLEFELD